NARSQCMNLRKGVARTLCCRMQVAKHTKCLGAPSLNPPDKRQIALLLSDPQGGIPGDQRIGWPSKLCEQARYQFQRVGLVTGALVATGLCCARFSLLERLLKLLGRCAHFGTDQSSIQGDFSSEETAFGRRIDLQRLLVQPATQQCTCQQKL